MSKYGTISSRRHIQLISCERLVVIILSTNQYITLFYVHFLFKDILFNVYRWFFFKHWTQPTANKRSLSKTLIFSIRHIPIFLNLGKQNRISTLLCLGSHFNNKSPTKSTNVKIMAINRPQKGHLFATWELEQRGRAILLDLGQKHWVTPNFYHSAQIYKGLKICQSLILKLRTNFSKQANSQMCNPQIMKMLIFKLIGVQYF